MGTKGISIITFDHKELISLLNKALADEWFAYYQYWVGAKVLKGIMSDSAKKELNEHAEEELKHANMLTDRIIQLNGTPILNPTDWAKLSTCGYLAPENFSVIEILKQNIKGEQCAINFYNNLLKNIKDKDILTYQMVLSILQDEVDHEDDLEKLLEDIKMK